AYESGSLQHTFIVVVLHACSLTLSLLFFFFFNDTPTTEIYTLSLHDALPISALFDVPGRGEEPSGALQRVGVEPARQDLARRRDDGVVGAGKAGEGVEQDHDVAFVLDEPLGLLDDHVGHLDVPLWRLVERGRDDLALHR